MTELSQVKNAIVTALNDAGVKAVTSFREDRLKAYETAVVAAGNKAMSVTGAAQMDYLGQRYDAEKGAVLEVYGKRMALSVSLDIYAPRTVGAEGCEEAAGRTAEVLMSALPGGLKLNGLSWRETAWDKTYGMFHLSGTADYTAYFTAIAGEDDVVFTDFILRGVVQGNE